MNRTLKRVAGSAGVLMHAGSVRTMFGPPGDAKFERAVHGKVALVTGASAGTGAAVARQLGEAGATVILVARSQDKLQAVQADIAGAGGLAHVHPCDMSDVDAVARLASDVLERHGRVDIVVSNAGKSIRRSLELSYDRFRDFQRTIDVNYNGPVRLMLALIPQMRANGGGHIINVSTMGVYLPSPRYSAYLASKSAFDMWVRCVGPELRKDGIAFTSMYFGLVHTDMSAGTTMYRYMPGLTPERAADDVAWALVRRPLTTGPTWAKYVGLAAEVARTPWERLNAAYYDISLDSASARGVEGDGGFEVPLMGAALKRAGIIK
ncbi:MAG: SDR family NAD(P)-dependent oxidoreductase [Thermoleophilaceae bacterium]